MNGTTARNLPPAAFAPVMATGIVSQGLAAAGAPRTSDALLAVAMALYAGLLAGLVWRVARHPRDVAADLRDTGRVFGFFTFVAGSDVLAARLAHGPWRSAAAPLTLVAVPVCAVLLGCAARVVRGIGAGGAVRRAEGTWFLCVVGIQSAVLAVAGPAPGRGLPGTAIAWAAGLLLYAAVATLVARRLLRFGVPPRELSPPYWIAMGACAISLLAGARLAHPGLDAGFPHLGQGAVRAGALALVQVLELRRARHDLADVNGVVGPVGRDPEDAAGLDGPGGEISERRLNEAALVMPGLVPWIREEHP